MDITNQPLNGNSQQALDDVPQNTERINSPETLSIQNEEILQNLLKKSTETNDIYFDDNPSIPLKPFNDYAINPTLCNKTVYLDLELLDLFKPEIADCANAYVKLSSDYQNKIKKHDTLYLIDLNNPPPHYVYQTKNITDANTRLQALSACRKTETDNLKSKIQETREKIERLGNPFIIIKNLLNEMEPRQPVAVFNSILLASSEINRYFDQCKKRIWLQFQRNEKKHVAAKEHKKPKASAVNEDRMDIDEVPPAKVVIKKPVASSSKHHSSKKDVAPKRLKRISTSSNSSSTKRSKDFHHGADKKGKKVDYRK